MIEGWRFGPYELRSPNRSVTSGSRLIDLTVKEHDVLKNIMLGNGSMVKTVDINRIVWPGSPVDDNSNIKSCIRFIRPKLSDIIVRNIKDTGYIIECDIERIGSVQEKFAEYLIAVLAEAEEHRQVMSDVKWDRIYLKRIGELRSSLDWAMEKRGRRHIAIALFGVGARLFERASLVPEGRSYADRILDLVDHDTYPAAEALLLRQAGILYREVDRMKAMDLFMRSSTIYRTLPDNNFLGDVLALLGGTYLYMGQYDNARIYLEESECILKNTSQKKAICNVYNELGFLYNITSFPKKSRIYFEHAHGIARNIKDNLRHGIILLNWAELEFYQGSLDRAIIRAQEAYHIMADCLPAYRLRALVNLATYYALAGDLDRAMINAESALALSRAEGGYWLRLCLQVCALIVARLGRYVESARLMGFVDQQFALFGEARQRAEQQIYELLRQALSEHFTSDSLEVWLAEGGRFSEAQAVDLVICTLVISQDRAAE